MSSPEKSLGSSTTRVITSLEQIREVERNYLYIGLETVPEEVLLLRFRHFLLFLQEQGLTLDPLADHSRKRNNSCCLRQDDLTSEGIAFVSHSLNRWLHRSCRDDERSKQESYLLSWYHDFLVG